MNQEEQGKLIVVVFGLPGTGKSTFARLFSRRLGFTHLNTDVIRHLLHARQKYLDHEREHIYDQMMLKSEEVLSKNENLVLDGTFYGKSQRLKVQNIASRNNAQVKWIQITANETTVEERMKKKRKFSEADFGVYEIVRAQFEPFEEVHLSLPSDQMTIDEMIEQAIQFVRA